MLGVQSIKSLQNILNKLAPQISTESRDVTRFQTTDKYLQKETDRTTETLEGEHAMALGNKKVIRNVEVPVTFIYKDTAQAFMTATFLTGYPIFASVAPRDKEEAASMLTSLSGRDQQRFGWVGELQRCNDDALRYNLCAAETLWTAKRALSATTKIVEGSTTTGAAAPIIYEGNMIRRIDPYNLIYDRSVEPHKVHIDGTYVGYVEVVDYIRLKKKYLEWNDIYTIKKNISSIFEGAAPGNYTHYYYQPTIRKDAGTGPDRNYWATFWGNNTTHDMTGSMGRYELVTLYMRLIPKEYYITDVPESGNPQTFKLIWVNGHLAYVEPISAGHDYLPIVVGQLYPGSSEVKSFTEYLQDLQDLSTSLLTGTLDSMRRAVGDRALYDPTKIRKQDIENPSPVAKIPIMSNVYGATNLEGIFKHIPYNDNISGQFSGAMNTALMLAQETTGINRSAQGNFIKGNKTSFEFDTIMSNSQARLQLGALNLENSFYAPIKEIIKLNYLIYAQAEEIENRQTGTTVQVDPAMLREVAPDFKMADGILPSTKLANTEVLVQAINAIGMDPMLALEYDTGGIIVSILRQQGFTDIHQYKRTPEQMQMYMQMMQANAATRGSGNAEQSNSAGQAPQS